MATSSSFFTLRRGSTKSLTFQVYRGKQVTKDRVGKPANPQSSLQMEQRIKMAPVAQTRSALQFIVNHSFEGVPYGQKSLLYFSKINLDANNSGVDILSYAYPGTTGTSVGKYQISKGSLIPLSYKIEATDGFFSFDSDSSFAIPTEKSAYISAIFEKLGLSDDALLSFVYATPSGVQVSANISGEEKPVDVYSWHVARLSKNDNSINSAWQYKAGTNEDYLTDGQTSIRFQIDTASNDIITLLVTTKNIEDPEDMFMFAAIQSERDGDNWKRSTQYLAARKPVNVVTPADVANALLKSSKSGKYLNLGGSGSTKLQFESSETIEV